jgi:hypothetical protein
VYDYAYTNDDGCVFNKIVFVMWSPECSPLKHKMMYASTKDYFRHFLQGIAMCVCLPMQNRVFLGMPPGQHCDIALRHREPGKPPS